MAWLTRLVASRRSQLAEERHGRHEAEATIERYKERVWQVENERNSLRLELTIERQRSEAADRRIGELLRLLADRRTT